MKIRNGFVSNSSSSSFVIGYRGNKKYTKEAVHQIMRMLVKLEQEKNPKVKFEDIFSFKFDAHAMFVGDKDPKFIETIKDYEKGERSKTDFKKLKGKIVIHSIGDNTIPYWMTEFFLNNLDARYYHWG